MEPPNAELEQMTTMDKTFKWAQFKVDDVDTKEAVSGSLPTNPPWNQEGCSHKGAWADR